MSVVKIALVSGREATFGKITENESKLRWLCETSSNFDTEDMIASYGYSNNILPLPYVSYQPIYSMQLCRKILMAQDSTAPRKWDINATYSSEPLKESDNPVEDPTLRPVKIKWKAQPYRKVVDRDNDGKAILNSAGDYFDPPLEKDASHWVATITKNVESVPTSILIYTDAINANSFQIQGMAVNQYVAKIVDLEISELQTEGDFEYYTFTYALEFRPHELWHPFKVLDQGTRYMDGSAMKVIMDDATPPRPVSSPRLLDGLGGVLGSPSPTTAVYRDFSIYIARNFLILPGLNEIG